MGPLVRRQIAVAARVGYRGGDLPAHRHRAPRAPAGRRGGRHLRGRGPVVRGLVHGAGGADGGRVSGALEPSVRRSGLPARPAGLARCAVRGGACACGLPAVCRPAAGPPAVRHGIFGIDARAADPHLGGRIHIHARPVEPLVAGRGPAAVLARDARRRCGDERRTQPHADSTLRGDRSRGRDGDLVCERRVAGAVPFGAHAADGVDDGEVAAAAAALGRPVAVIRVACSLEWRGPRQAA